MACSKCKEVIDPSLKPAQLDYLTTGRLEQSPLVRVPNRPFRGWSVTLPLKGSPQRIDGLNPYEVAHNAVKLFKLNGFHLDKNQLWFNLNIQWLQRTNVRYHLTPLPKLMEMAVPVTIENTDSHAMKKTDLESWSPCFFTFAKAYADSDTYQWETFLGFLNTYQKMLNPAENALLGDSKHYRDFTLALDKLKNNPAFESQKAKDWLLGIQ